MAGQCLINAEIGNMGTSRHFSDFPTYRDLAEGHVAGIAI